MSARPDQLQDSGLHTLDPTSWDEFRRVGHEAVDAIADYLDGVRQRPVCPDIPDDVRRRFDAPAPSAAVGIDGAYREFVETVLPYPHGNIHPRFWGWVLGTGSAAGVIGEMLSAAMNNNTGFGDNAAIHLERQVIRWLRDAIGYAPEAGGILVGGCTIANIVGLAVARNQGAGVDVRQQGVSAAGPLAVYGSTETHSSNHRALELLGLGRDAFRAVGVDADYRVRVDELRARIEADVAAGIRPVAIIATAGTVNTGAFDDLDAVAEVAREFGIWLHVDGAFGALAGLAPALKHLTSGIERADSVAFDLHKWLHVPYDVGAVLVRDRRVHHDNYRMLGAYLSAFDSRLASGPINFMEHGLQMSRGFRAAKVWMTIKAYGLETLGSLIAQNVDQARYLAERVDAHPRLERLAPAPLNIVCCRYVAPGLSDEELDDLNRRIVERLHDDGVVAPSFTVLGGRFVIRAAITNHRSRYEDFDLLIDEVVRVAGDLT